jgi:hypothetical protein
VAKAKQKISE